MLRSYWKIESSLHYPRDVTLHEDQTRFKKHAAAHTMAIINNLFSVYLPGPTSILFHLPDATSPPIPNKLFVSYFEKALDAHYSAVDALLAV